MDREKLNSNFDINAKCEDMIKTSEMIVDKYQCIIDRGYEPSIYVSLAYDVKNYLSKLLKENQKYKEVIDKAIKYIEKNMKNVDYTGLYVETYTGRKTIPVILEELLDILKKVK